MTRHFPMISGIAGDSSDHPHHKSMWFAHGDVNGANIWNDISGEGFSIHRRFVQRVEGPVLAGFLAENDWANSQKEPVVKEQEGIWFWNIPEVGNLIDVKVSFFADYGDVVFGDTKEGGLVSLRMRGTMDEKKGGRITNSCGGIGEAECWGKQANWCSYSGPIMTDQGLIEAGAVIYDNPANPRYPTFWHVRAYGLMTANPFGHHDYYADNSRDGSLLLPKGSLITFLYRIYLYEGGSLCGVSEKGWDYLYPVHVICEWK